MPLSARRRIRQLGSGTARPSQHTGGYRGRSTALLIVENPAGMRIERAARLMQLVFFTLDAPTARGYDGTYQNENIGVDRSAQSRRA